LVNFDFSELKGFRSGGPGRSGWQLEAGIGLRLQAKLQVPEFFAFVWGVEFEAGAGGREASSNPFAPVQACRGEAFCILVAHLHDTGV
jgi:hypothetical protein